jgi:hypothetical protein
VAFYFRDVIEETAGARHIQLGKVEQTAMPGLLLYHKQL